MKTKLIRATVGAAIASAGLCMSASAFASTDDDAFAAAYRQELAQKAIANSKTNFEVQSTTQARQNDNCNKLKVVKTNAIQRSVQMHMPSDPTKVVENTTCFQNVLATKIPSTGFGFADQIISSLLSQYAGGGCTKTTNQWSGMVGSVQSGNYQQLFSSSQYADPGASVTPLTTAPVSQPGSNGWYTQSPTQLQSQITTGTQGAIQQVKTTATSPSVVGSFLGSITGTGN